MAQSKPRITITDNCKDRLTQLAKKLDLSVADTVEHLIDNYTNGESNNNDTIELKDYNNSEQEEINLALKNSGLSLKDITKTGTLQRVRYLNSVAESQAKLDSMSEEDLKKATFRGVAEHRIAQTIETIKEHNDKQAEKVYKICLTRGVVFKLTGSNRKNINEFFDKYQLMIDDHNNKHQLTPLDNRKGKLFDLKECLGV